MNIPGWSTMILVPLFFLVTGFSVISKSEKPVTMGLVTVVSGFVVGLIAWIILSAKDRAKRRR